jgi:hypothetical protein
VINVWRCCKAGTGKLWMRKRKGVRAKESGMPLEYREGQWWLSQGLLRARLRRRERRAEEEVTLKVEQR